MNYFLLTYYLFFILILNIDFFFYCFYNNILIKIKFYLKKKKINEWKGKEINNYFLKNNCTFKCFYLFFFEFFWLNVLPLNF